uniref:Uncharacterized protein n=2 Tax=Coccidioides posadasii TaxID=199306 RepID=A0A0J6FKG0_COCPO|nr:hypothetical protein CPAG_05651 [Coccidioides posadasii RMSCC 3488]
MAPPWFSLTFIKMMCHDLVENKKMLLITREHDSRCTNAEIKGTRLHKLHDDPTDQKDMISIRFLNEDDKHVGTGHLHEDGMSKF